MLLSLPTHIEVAGSVLPVQESMLKTLHQKVAEVYTRCIGGNEATISTLQMLTAIETRLEELFETVEGLPPDKVETAEKVLFIVCEDERLCAVV